MDVGGGGKMQTALCTKEPWVDLSICKGPRSK
jgi:hypothetical protein